MPQNTAHDQRESLSGAGFEVHTPIRPAPETSGKFPNNPAQRAVLYPLLCSVAFLVCVALAHPFADSAFNDDWSYSHVALKLAETGQLHYNGWGSPTILFQTLWGAAWIHFFGFSFDILRAATIPFSGGFLLLVYALQRRAGLTSALALFGALAIGTSPLFLPLAASFMTDAYGCFFIALCIYAAMASAQAEGSASATRWLWVLAISGAIGGSNRQMVWAAPLGLIPYLWWRARANRRFALHALAAFVFSAGLAALVLAIFPQPYAPLQLSPRQMAAILAHNGFVGLAWMADLGFSGLLVSLPVLLAFLPLWKKLKPESLIACCLVATAGTALLPALFGANHGLAPFLGNIVTPFGILEAGQDAPGFRPAILPLLVRVVLTWLVLFSAAAFARLCTLRRNRLAPIPGRVFLIFFCAYISLLMPGALLRMTYDRYLLPLLPVVLAFVLQRFQGWNRKVPGCAWACLFVFALYSVATTHDYFSGLRARTAAAQTLEKLGIPATRISAGLEHDGWTQLQAAGKVGPFRYDGEPIQAADAINFAFWPRAYALTPEYVASYSSAQDLPEKRLVTVPFDTWLPPFRRAVTVIQRASLSKNQPSNRNGFGPSSPSGGGKDSNPW